MKINKDNKLFAEIDAVIGSYRTNYIELQTGLTYSQYLTLRTIDFYSNSKFLGGNLDQLGREKPFYNISNFRVNVAMRATDIDIKDCEVKADTLASRTQAFLLNHELYEWMKEADFDVTLNQIGETMPRYGGALVKKLIEEDEDGESLCIDVPEWKNLVTDQIDIEGGIKIERHWLSPKAVWDKQDVWDNVAEAVKLASKIRQNVTNNGVNTKGNTKEVQILDVEGYFADDMNPSVECECGKDCECESMYRLMHFIIATNNNEYILMFSEELEESQYKYKAWNKVAGRALGKGIMEDGFDAQVWANDAIISQKNAMDLAGKVVLKTNSKKVGNNILTDADNGRIFELEDGKDITPINLMPFALPQFETLLTQWDTQFEKVSSTFGAITGETMPSGTPYRQVAVLNNEASSIFDYRKKDKANFVAEILNDWVLPWLIDNLNKKHILTSEFSKDELANMDEDFGNAHALEVAKQQLLQGQGTTGSEFNNNKEQFKADLNKASGSDRYLTIPDGFFDDFEGKVSINIAGELKDQSAQLETLSNLLQTVAKVPQVLSDPNMKQVFDQILEISGVISPVSMGSVQAQAPQPMNGSMASMGANQPQLNGQA